MSAIEWLKGVSSSQPELLEKYHISKYEIRKEIFVLGKDTYVIKIENNDNDLGEIYLNDNELKILVPLNLDEFDKRIMVRNLISKLFAKRYKKFVEERVKYWNERHFNKHVKSVTLRYNSTNWGSCSTTDKINISTRSLLLPLEVFDYIIVHELSHLIEMNHSDNFWKVVENVMPNYLNSEKWIKENSTGLDF